MDIKKLQSLVVDALEDVKAQDITLFDTTHLTSLFDRIAIASGTSNRQTKALAASVRDAVREAGFGKPRIEGEDNGEWIIVDCGAAVVHIMQPAIRQYYHLEELWGDKPIRLKFGAVKPVVPAPVVEKAPAKKPAAKKVVAKTASGRSVNGRTAAKLARSTKPEVQYAPPRPELEPAGKKAPARKAAGKSAVPAKTPAKTVAKAPAKTLAKTPVKTPVKAAVKTLVVKPSGLGKKAAAKNAAAKNAPAKSAPARKAPAKKAAPRA